MRHNIMFIGAFVICQIGVSLMKDYALYGTAILVAGVVVMLIDYALCRKEHK